MKLAHLVSAIKYYNSSLKKKEITFYSEGRQNFPFLESLIHCLLKENHKISYLSSSNNDPAKHIKSLNFYFYTIGNGFSRSWLFKNLKAKIMIMTVPGLETTQLKRSRYRVHYIYIQHSLASLHGIYPKGSFDHFDTVFCSTPYHIKEMKKIKTIFHLKSINIIEHGYPRIESLKKHLKTFKHQKISKKNILIAPSWGNNCLIESKTIFKLLENLLKAGYNVTLRPHPETFKSSETILKKIKNTYLKNKNFQFEDDINISDSLFNSYYLITDWSGIAFEHYILFKKPIIFIDVKQKINNEDFLYFNMKTEEDTIRNKIGIISDSNNISLDIKLASKNKEYEIKIFENADINAYEEINKILKSINS